MLHEEVSPIISRRKVELSNLESSVLMGETLPPEYDSILKETQQYSASKTFAKQAREVTYYFYALDSGKALLDGNGEPIDLDSFAKLVASLHFVTLLYMKARRNATAQQVPAETNSMITRRRVVSLGNPETAFPQWIRSHVKLSEGDANQDYSSLSQFYDQWSHAHSESMYEGRYGYYSVYPETITPPKSDKADGRFKGYIEINSAKDNLQKAFENLVKKKAHPHETKFFDGSRMVLYWLSEPDLDLIESIKESFKQANVYFRGPGQDSDYFVRQEGGQIETTFRVSNDGALGEGGHSLDFNQDSFNATTFLKNYLEQCYRYWRNPLNPYLLSFMPAFDKSGGDVQELQKLQSKVNGELVVMNTWVPRLFSQK